MNVNYGATLNLLEAIKSFSPNCRILIPGSGEEYGEVQVEKLPIGVDTPLNPVNPYAVTKVAQDLIGYVYHKSYGLNVIRVRTFNHEGPRRERYFGISSYCFQLARMELGLQQNVLKVGDIKDKRNFIHVSDIVKAYLIAMRMCTPGELYLIGAEKPENIATFEEVISKLIGKIKIDKKIDIEQIKEFTRPTSVPYLIADSSKFSNLTGWEPSKSLDEILEDVLEYWRSRVRIHPSL
jgi:GDP-4-dehydro-6-deoxy-D-mannose reductase